MVDAMFSLGILIIKFFLLLFLVIIILLVPFFLVAVGFLIYYLAKGKRFKPKTKISTYTKRNIFLVLFWDFPRRVVLDWFERDPDEFDYYGLWLFAGEQGSGKTIAMIWFMRMIKQKFPDCHICSNIDISFQDGKIKEPGDIVFTNNGKWGQIECIDEMQNWFNSSDSRNFPPYMIQEICQERKQHKMLMGTSQRFNRVALPLRQQVNFLCKPMTFAGCLTWLRIYKPNVSEDGKVSKARYIKSYLFVHDDELRSCYDTRQKVEHMTLTGFLPRSEQLQSDINSVADTVTKSAVNFIRRKK